MNNNKLKRRLLIQTTSIALASQWTKPVINFVVSPVHAQTSTPTPEPTLCEDGTSTWVMSNYIENGIAFSQGSPQSQVEITISGTTVSLVTDWFILNSSNNSESRGRTTDQGTIDLSSGAVTTNPVGTPTVSPTHGGLTNLANSLTQSFTLACADSSDFVVSDDAGIYSFTLSRIS